MQQVLNSITITELYTNEDQTVHKYIHESGAETTIKTVPSCSNVVSDEAVSIEFVNRNKASVFISVSVGCPLNCAFCYLTVKKFKYAPLTPQEIIVNTLDAVLLQKEELQGKYLKLAFMGMGDILAIKGFPIFDVVRILVTSLMEQKLVAGIDGVDIGSVVPTENLQKFTEDVRALNEWLLERKEILNPIYNYVDTASIISIASRTPVRLFLSLHHPVDVERKKLLPSSINIFSLFELAKNSDLTCVFHYTLVKNVNDDETTLQYLIDMFTRNIFELRLLRYNVCTDAPFEAPTEEEFMKVAVQLAKSSIYRFKYQVSVGSEIQAACGQFICKVKSEV